MSRQHDSDCAVHNEPAYPAGKCDCSVSKKKQDNGTTHYAGCIQAGPKHYECALQEIGRLRLTITHLRAELEKETQRRFDGNEIASKEHREEVAAFMKMGDRLIEERKVAAKAAKAEYGRGFDDGFILRKEKDANGQSEYICSCGIRVTPHKCPKDNDF